MLGRLATAEIGTEARENLSEAFAHWITAITKLAAESGMSPVRARHFAEDWIARLQGALIYQAATGNLGPFERVMSALLELGKEETKHAKS